MRGNLLHVGIVVAAGVIIGVGSYLLVALLVLLDSVVSLWILGALVLVGIVLAFLYDYLGPNLPPPEL